MNNDDQEIDLNLFGRPDVKSEFILKKEADFKIIRAQRKVPTESEKKHAKELVKKLDEEMEEKIANFDPSLLESYMRGVNPNEP